MAALFRGITCGFKDKSYQKRPRRYRHFKHGKLTWAAAGCPGATYNSSRCGHGYALGKSSAMPIHPARGKAGRFGRDRWSLDRGAYLALVSPYGYINMPIPG